MSPVQRMAPGCRGHEELKEPARQAEVAPPQPAPSEPAEAASDEWPAVERHPV